MPPTGDLETAATAGCQVGSLWASNLKSSPSLVYSYALTRLLLYVQLGNLTGKSTILLL